MHTHTHTLTCIYIHIHTLPLYARGLEFIFSVIESQCHGPHCIVGEGGVVVRVVFIIIEAAGLELLQCL